MRNVFDQYGQLENRVTHALAVSLSEDPALLRAFVREFGVSSPPAGAHVVVEEQSVPGEPQPSEEEAERRGLPDAWIHDGEGWALLIECKVTAPVNVDQLRRHLRTASRRGFPDPRLLLISATRYERSLPAEVCATTWRDIYSWLRKQEFRSTWAAKAATYLEIVEARLMEMGSMEDTLTEFTGFPFGAERPYNYLEAKRLLRLALGELRMRTDLQRRVGMDPSRSGRKAITGRDGQAVWDFLPLRHAQGTELFTNHPHLTLAVENDRVLAHVTLPNGLAPPLKKRLRSLSLEGLGAILAEVEAGLRPLLSAAPGSAPWVVGVQRHYPTQRSLPIVDASIQFDLRAVVPVPDRARGSVAPQPCLLQAVHAAIQNRRPNFQLSVGLAMPYRSCAIVRDRGVLDVIAAAWVGCGALLRLLLPK